MAAYAAWFLLGAAMSLAADNPAAVMAYEALKQKDYDQAIAAFRQAIQTEPERHELRRELAYTLLKTGETELAREVFGEIVRLAPSDWHSALEYGYLCHETRRVLEARRAFDRVRKNGDAAARAAAEQAFQSVDRPLADAMSRWFRALTQNPGDYSAHVELADAAADRDEWKTAAEHFLAAWSLRPNDRQILVELGHARKESGDLEGAHGAWLAAARGTQQRAAEKARELLPRRHPYASEFRRALELDRGNVELRRELAFLYLAVNQAADAEAEFRNILEFAPSDLLSLAQLGFLRLARGDREGAMPYLNKVLQGRDATLVERVRDALEGKTPQQAAPAAPQPPALQPPTPETLPPPPPRAQPAGRTDAPPLVNDPFARSQPRAVGARTVQAPTVQAPGVQPRSGQPAQPAPAPKPTPPASPKVEPVSSSPQQATPIATEPGAPKPAPGKTDPAKEPARKDDGKTGAEKAEPARMDAPKPDAAKSDVARSDGAKFDAGADAAGIAAKSDTTKSERSRSDTVEFDSTGAMATESHTAKSVPMAGIAAKSDTTKSEPSRSSTARPDGAGPDPMAVIAARAITARAEQARSDTAEFGPSRSDAARFDQGRPDPAAIAVRSDGVSPDPMAAIAASGIAAKSDTTRSDTAKSDATGAIAAKPGSEGADAASSARAPKPAATNPKSLGDKSYSAGYLKDALRYYELARQENPRDPETQLKLGYTHNMLRQDEEAIRYFDMARRGPDAKVRAQANRAYHNLRPMTARFRSTGWLFPMYSSRWHEAFSYGQWKVDMRLGNLPFRPYFT
ncbi:MAG: tetratricopeptide repeat protein, partial [Bryobacterales bacterium]|nr:tetratricopeptide repeat protein [Bryobacterales bacterium]